MHVIVQVLLTPEQELSSKSDALSRQEIIAMVNTLHQLTKLLHKLLHGVLVLLLCKFYCLLRDRGRSTEQRIVQLALQMPLVGARLQ